MVSLPWNQATLVPFETDGIDEWRSSVRRESSVHGECRGKPVGAVAVGLGQRPAGVMRRAADRNQSAVRYVSMPRESRSWHPTSKRDRYVGHSLCSRSRPKSGCLRSQCSYRRTEPRREYCPQPGFGVVGLKSVQRLLRPVGGRFPSQRSPRFNTSLEVTRQSS